MAEYLRELVLAEKATKQAMNSVDLIRNIDQVGQAMGKTALNIHEIAINLSRQEKNQCIEPQIITQFNGLMEQYLQDRKELANAYRSLMRGK
ncbi:MAG: hypothetical protein U5K79_03690 [Cyclobacteriaceae bacterium]|nr:hypothetical protein [Cyclobacteriaceae bacterium]